MEIIREYGTPLRLSYLPKISQHIRNAKKIFQEAFKKHNYQGGYQYAYCTKSSHFRFILEEALKNEIHLETSSAFDIDIIQHLDQSQKIDKSALILCNGYKPPAYTQGIANLLMNGRKCIPILDNLTEIEAYEHLEVESIELGIRVATDEEPKFGFYTSRLGIRYSDVGKVYQEKIASNDKLKLKMLHFFINTGIRDSAYYWSELSRFMSKYCELKAYCPELDTVDIGGGLPIRTSLKSTFDYEYMIHQIVEYILWICKKNKVPEPNIITEFGNYTVGESGAMIYSVVDQKLQNDKELWYMIDGSFITHLPDVWGSSQKYIMLAINHWGQSHHKVNLGGLTCDSHDYYNSEMHSSEVFLPKAKKGEKQYLGFFHTGAYQESLGGYGGIQHCLIPAAQHVIINQNEAGEVFTSCFAEHQSPNSMLKILGYQ